MPPPEGRGIPPCTLTSWGGTDRISKPRGTTCGSFAPSRNLGTCIAHSTLPISGRGNCNGLSIQAARGADMEPDIATDNTEYLRSLEPGNFISRGVIEKVFEHHRGSTPSHREAFEASQASPPPHAHDTRSLNTLGCFFFRSLADPISGLDHNPSQRR